MADKFMYIPNDNKQNYPFCRIKLVVETFGDSTKWAHQSKCNKSPQRIRQRFYKLWGLM